MVGGTEDVHLAVEKPEERVCVTDDSVKPQALSNGKLDKDFEPALGGDVIGKLTDLCPFTPKPKRENGDSVIGSSSPLSSESPPRSLNVVRVLDSKSNECVMDSRLDDSPRTPKEGVFDPFAPGPDQLLLAPICNKLLLESKNIVARRLDFDDVDGLPDVKDVDTDDEDMWALSEKLFLEKVYGTLLEAIVKKQIEDFVPEDYPLESQHLHTPTSPPRLTGIAETCLGAPIKAVARKTRNIDPALCRKLEF